MRGYPKLDVGEGKEADFSFVLPSCHSVKAVNLGDEKKVGRARDNNKKFVQEGN